jgi:hypothetical protein
MADNDTQPVVNGPKMTKWKKEPGVRELKLDLESSKNAHDIQVGKIKTWNDLLQVKGAAKPKKIKGRSSVQPKLIRRQAEWRYSALTEPFLGTDKLFKVSPETGEDGDAARQNELVLNHQFRTKFNRVKFIDDFVRSTVDEGTSIIRVGWKRSTMKVMVDVPVYEHRTFESEEEANVFKAALELMEADPRHYESDTPPNVKAAIDYYLESEEATFAVDTGQTEKVEQLKILENRPTAEIMNPSNVFIDPSCGGDIEKATFIAVTFETCKADLIKDGKYKNLDKVVWSSNTPLATPDHETTTPQDFNLNDDLRRKVVAYEYWGYYDINGDDRLVPIVATWIGDVLIRLEENPFPDEKLPFIVVPYLPVKRDVYGEPDAELLEDNQAILGAVTRGMIDLLGRSANGQQGFAKGMLDPLNRRRYESGQDYEFNPNVSPQIGLIEHKYPDIPQSAMLMLNLQNQEAEALTGVKSFSGGMSGEAYGDVAAGIKGVLDASSKREMAILRRLAKGIQELGSKIIAMNAVFLSEEETIRITNTEFEVIRREDLAGNFDLIVDISTAEVDNAQASDLAFMLQTIGNNMDFGMTQLILAEICRLKRMPELRQQILNFQPQPDPLAQELQKLQIEELRLKVLKLQSEVKLNEAKTEKTEAEADATSLEFVETQDGTRHAREMEKTRGQAQGNMDRDVVKALVTPKKEGEKAGDVEAAIGFSQLANSRDNETNVRPKPLPAPVPMAPPVELTEQPVEEASFPVGP